MNRSESLARKFLLQQGFQTVVYEPDGNVPPDFLCDGRVAVEVRRITQMEEAADGGNPSLEELPIPIAQKIRALLSELGSPNAAVSWFVHYRFRRPIPDRDDLKHALAEHLSALQLRTEIAWKEFQIQPNFFVDVFPASKVHLGQKYVLAGFSDMDAGG